MVRVKQRLRSLANRFLKKEPKNQILYQGESLFGKVCVRLNDGQVELITGAGHRQSAYRRDGLLLGSVWDYYITAFAFLPAGARAERVCLLGLGGGVAAKLISRVFHPKTLVGVEVDPTIISLSQKYFGLPLDNLKIVCAPAAEYLRKETRKFDVILVDTFQQDAFAKDCQTESFYADLLERLTPPGLVLVNRALTQKQEGANRLFQEIFTKTFAGVYTLRVRQNIFYFGLNQRLEKTGIIGNIRELSQKPDLAFLKDFDPRSLNRLPS